MPKATEEDIERIFLVWAGEGEQDDSRTAELCGIPRTTVGYYKRTRDWPARFLSVAGPDSEVAANTGRAMMRYGIPIVARRLLAIVGQQIEIENPETGEVRKIWASEDRDAVNAAKVLAAYGLGQPTAQDATGLGAIPAESWVKSEVPEGEETIEQLRQRAAAMIEATVASVNTRTRIKGKHRV